MKLGYLTLPTPDTIANARRLGFDSIEASAGWFPQPTLDETERNLAAIRDALQTNNIAVTSVALYGNTTALPLDDVLDYFRRTMKLARNLGCGVVSAMTGRDNSLTIDENLPIFERYFTPIARMAEDEGLRIAFEPWAGRVVGHGPYHRMNMATTPELWDRLFETVPSPALGIEYDPSHLIWQGIDYLQAIRDYASRIYHVHAKDIVIDQAKLKRVGVHGAGWWRFVMPGLGVVDWPALFDALKEVGYTGDMAVEHEDDEYMGDRWNEGLTLALKTLRPLMGDE